MKTEMELRIGAFASHGGSNLQAILDACGNRLPKVSVALVISNNSDSFALERARKAGVPAFHVSLRQYQDQEQMDEAILGLLQSHGVNFITLCGYMKKMGNRIIDAYSGRIINIHPALLPAYGGKGMFGMHVHEAVLRAGETRTGATVHLVNREYDQGPVLLQEVIRIRKGETPESLRDRVLQVEHRLYVKTLEKISSGEIRLP